MARAIIIIISAIFSFAAMGVVVRMLTAGYPVLQISFIRNFFWLLPILLLLAYSRQMHALKTPFSRHEWGVCMVRGASVSLAQYCLFMAYSLLEFATAATLAFAGPFFVTALSVPVLRMRVGLWRWSAVCMGFAGVVMIMQPGAGVFSSYAVLPVVAAFCYAVSSTAVKTFSPKRLSGVIQFRSQIFAALFSLGLWLAFAEVTPIASGFDLGLFFALGFLGGFGVLGLVVAYRITQPSLLAPFGVFWDSVFLVIGLVVFDEAPIDRLFPGVLAIVAGGMVIIWRQMRAHPEG